MLFLFNLYSEELQTSTLRRSRRKTIIIMIIMKVDLPQPLKDDSYCFQNNVLWVFRSSLTDHFNIVAFGYVGRQLHQLLACKRLIMSNYCKPVAENPVI